MGNEFSISSGNLIRAARQKMGLSQTEVARLADVSRRTVQNAESGKSGIKMSSLRAIGDAVHLDFHDGGQHALCQSASSSSPLMPNCRICLFEPEYEQSSLQMF